MRAERVVLLASLCLAAGCYSYVPARMDALEPGQAVRIRLSPEEADRLEPVRRSAERLLEGTMVEAAPDRVTVDTPVTRLDPMSGTRALVQTVDVSRPGIVEVELRRRDDLKTGAAVAALALVVGAGVAAALERGGGEGEHPGPNPQEVRLPLLRLVVP